MRVKEISGFPDYEISSDGRVFSWKSGGRGRKRPSKPRTLSPVLNKARGYLYVNLRDAGFKRCFVSLHRIVATAFHDNPNNLPQVNHKDKNRLNNDESNLEWCTEEENMIHASGKEVSIMSPEGEVVTAESINKLARITNLDKGALTRLYNGEYTHTKGWILYVQ